MLGCLYPFQCRSVEISLSCVSPHLVSPPGKVVTVNFMIQNNSNFEATLEGDLKLPPGWKPIYVEKNALTLPAHDQMLCTFAFQVPRDALAKTYQIEYSIPSLGEKCLFDIGVEPYMAFEGQLEDKPLILPAGIPFSIDCRLINRGNISLPISLEAVADPACEVVTFFDSCDLLPNSETNCQLTITPEDCPNAYTQFVFIKVRNQDTDEILYRTTLLLEVLPRGVKTIDPYVRIPAMLRLIACGDNHNTVAAAEFAGGGVIDEERGRRLDFLVRLPTDLRNVIYEQYQRFFFGFVDPAYEVVVGDTTYIMSPLTEQGMYGRGAGFKLFMDGLELGGFYSQNIFRTSYNQKDAGASISYEPREDLFFQGNFFHKELNRDPNSDILSVLAERDTGSSFTSAEVGYNFGKLKHCQAYRFETRGKIGDRGWYYFEKDYAGPNFFGYFTNLHYLGASVDYALTKPLRASFSTNFLKQNLRPTNCKRHHHRHHHHRHIFAPRQRQYNAVLTYQRNGAAIALTGMLLRAKDVKWECNYDFDQRWVGMNLSYARQNFSFVALSQIGEQKDFLRHKKIESLQRYSLYVNWSSSQQTQWSFVLDSGHTNYYDARPWRNSVGLIMRHQFLVKTWIEIFGQFVHNIPTGSNQYQIAFKYNHLFQNAHLLTLNFHQLHCSHFKGARDYIFFLSYAIPLTVPVKYRADIGHVYGQLLDEAQQMPIPDAIVSLDGERAFTDAQGLFSFPGICPGSYPFKTELLPTSLVTKVPEPQSVQVVGGKRTDLVVATVQSCRVAGQIQLFDYVYNLSGEGNVMEKGGLSNTFITLSSDNDEVFTYLSDFSGKFHFDNLRPGKWLVTIDATQLPKSHSLEFNDFYIEVAPNDSFFVQVKVLPKHIPALKPLLQKTD